MDYPGPPLNGFDAAAYKAHQVVGSPRWILLRRAEGRDSVVWMESQYVKGAKIAQISETVLLNLRDDLRSKVHRIRINGLMSVRITTDPISFAANKTDHYIPEDCPIEFIPIPLKEDR